MKRANSDQSGLDRSASFSTMDDIGLRKGSSNVSEDDLAASVENLRFRGECFSTDTGNAKKNS